MDTRNYWEKMHVEAVNVLISLNIYAWQFLFPHFCVITSQAVVLLGQTCVAEYALLL